MVTARKDAPFLDDALEIFYADGLMADGTHGVIFDLDFAVCRAACLFLRDKGLFRVLQACPPLGAGTHGVHGERAACPI